MGNVRLSYADCNNDGIIQASSEILEENNYYPFGLKHQGYNDIANSCRSEVAEKYQYNGKEFEDNFGLNIYAMDLRQYDPAIGRWVVQDPVIHHEFSPYSAFDNNPVYWADPSGADAIGVTIADLFNAADSGTTFIFDNGELIGQISSPTTVKAFLQSVYEATDIGTNSNGAGGSSITGGGNGNGGFSTGDLFALAAKNGVTSKTEAGLAFEKAVLEYLGLTPNKEKFKSKARMLKTGGKYSSVIPDAVSNINVYSLFGSGYYTNSHFHEVKAVTGWLNLISGSSDYQVLGLIDAIATSTLGGKDGRSILTFYTTSNTSISPEVIQYANQKNVTLKWSIAYTNNNLLYFTPPVTLSYSAQRQTIKIPIGIPQFQGVQIKF